MIFTFGALSFLPSPDGASSSGWEQGAIFAEAQNFARKLMDTPANLMTPSLFVDAVSAQLGEVPGVGRSQLEVIPRLVGPLQIWELVNLWFRSYLNFWKFRL